MWKQLERYELKRRGRSLSKLQPGERPVPSLPAGTDMLPQIKHIVVLMMENHSYDNYLGMLPGRGDGFTLGRDGQPTNVNPNADGKMIRAFHAPATQQADGVPCQSWAASHDQWNEGQMDGFVTATQAVDPGADETVGMSYWTEEDLPFYYGLARTFPLADRWFSSCMGPTFPNRRFLIAGTANGLVDDLPLHLLDYPAAGTILDSLTRHGISWINYHPVSGDKSQSRFRQLARHRRRMAKRRVKMVSEGFRNLADVQKDIVFTTDLFPLGIARHMVHVRGLDAFFEEADNGTLPAFSLVDPSFEEYSEENPQDIAKGESFAAEVINHVLHGKGWPNTLLIWTYDEHGGYYDHVPPPEAVPPDDIDGRCMAERPAWLRLLHRAIVPKMAEDAENDGGPMRYDRYGARVPAVIVSPYAKPDFVLSDVLDHTSVLKLVEEKWNLPTLTRRDAAALSPLAAVDLDAPPAFLEPPALPEPALKWGTW